MCAAFWLSTEWAHPWVITRDWGGGQNMQRWPASWKLPQAPLPGATSPCTTTCTTSLISTSLDSFCSFHVQYVLLCLSFYAQYYFVRCIYVVECRSSSFIFTLRSYSTVQTNTPQFTYPFLVDGHLAVFSLGLLQMTPLQMFLCVTLVNIYRPFSWLCTWS